LPRRQFQRTVRNYAEASEQQRAAFQKRSRQQTGDPAKLGPVIVDQASREKPPLLLPAGSGATDIIAAKIERLNSKRCARCRLQWID
jgi:hypothetical protein